jgi:hypothetical protein
MTLGGSEGHVLPWPTADFNIVDEAGFTEPSRWASVSGTFSSTAAKVPALRPRSIACDPVAVLATALRGITAEIVSWIRHLRA